MLQNIWRILTFINLHFALTVHAHSQEWFWRKISRSQHYRNRKYHCCAVLWNATPYLPALSPWYQQETECLSFCRSKLHSLHATVCASAAASSDRADIPILTARSCITCWLQIELFIICVNLQETPCHFGWGDMCCALWGTVAQMKQIYQCSCWLAINKERMVLLLGLKEWWWGCAEEADMWMSLPTSETSLMSFSFVVFLVSFFYTSKKTLKIAWWIDVKKNHHVLWWLKRAVVHFEGSPVYSCLSGRRWAGRSHTL